MKRKRRVGLLLAMVLLLQAVLPIAAAADETKEMARITWKKYSNVANAGFEDVLAGAPRKWTLSGGNVNDGFSIGEGKGNVHSGNGSLKMALESKDRPLYAAQTVSGARGGTEYTVSFWVKIVKRNDRGIAIKIEDPRGGMIVQKHFGDAPLNRWTEQSFTFMLSEGDSSFNMLLRLWDGGEVYWDDIAVTGQYDAEKDVTVEILSVPAEPAEPKVPETAPEDELFENGDFETLSQDGAGVAGWNAYRGWSTSNNQVTVSTENPYSGKNCVLVATAAGGNPWICQAVSEIEDETEYLFSIWYNTSVSNVAFKLEYYVGDEIKAGEALPTFENGRLETASATNGQWQQYVTTFTVPKGAKTLAIYPRLYAQSGEVYFDKASLSKTEQPRINLETDQVFYYSDREEDGVATVKANTKHYSDFEGSTVTFTLKDGDAVMDETEPMPITDVAEYRFSTKLMEKEKDYTVSATLFASDGRILEEKQQVISRWDRPTRITADGKYMVDGKEFVPVIAYNLPESAYSYCKEVGINVVQFAMTANLTVTRQTLDAAQENGLMVLACLYANMKPSAHPDNIENTKKIVEAVKDHPAVFAYAVLDEPHMQWNNLDDLFQKSYKTIRSIDKTRPIYLVEAEGNNGAYETTAKYCDIFAVDPYCDKEEITTNVEKHIKLAQEAVKYQKPVLSLFKTFGDENGYFPDFSDLRYEIYRAMMLGVSGVGIYRYANAYTKADGKAVPLSDTKLWSDWSKFNKSEYPAAVEDFITDPKPVFSDIITDIYYARTYVRGEKLSMVVMNRGNTDIQVSIPLTSSDGTVTVGGYSATVSGEDTIISGKGTLECTLKGTDVKVFEITPTAKVDFSEFYPSRFADLEGYGWARTQIDALDAADIVNDRTYKSFGPGEKITRGEFAYFLVRTMGLTAETADNFSDVDENAFYAKEIAIGKTLGILKGMGNNLYGPETEISRQDLMVICARAMELAPTEEEISFSDKEMIADYAMAEVAAMVRANIIKGNADGTINPLGNTTRAEAAVIMQRISDWAKEP